MTAWPGSGLRAPGRRSISLIKSYSALCAAALPWAGRDAEFGQLLAALSLPAEVLIGYFFLASNHLSCENDHGMHNGRDGQDLQKLILFIFYAKLVSLKQIKKQTNPNHAFASKPKIDDLGSSSQGTLLADCVSVGISPHRYMGTFWHSICTLETFFGIFCSLKTFFFFFLKVSRKAWSNISFCKTMKGWNRSYFLSHHVNPSLSKNFVADPEGAVILLHRQSSYLSTLAKYMGPSAYHSTDIQHWVQCGVKTYPLQSDLRCLITCVLSPNEQLTFCQHSFGLGLDSWLRGN